MTIGAARTPLALLIDLLASFAAVAVFVAVFGQDDGPAPSFITVAVFVLGSFTLARALQITDLDQDAMRVVGFAVSLVAIFVVLRIEYAPDEWFWEMGWFTGLFTDTADTIRPNAHVIAGSIVLAPLWMRGVVRGQSEIMFDSVLTSASAGMVAVIIAALALPDTRGEVSWGAFALAYAAAALLTLALYQAPEPEASLASFARRWTSAGAAIGGIVVAVAMFTAAVDPDAYGVLAPIGDPLRTAGDLAATYILGPIFWLAFQPFRGVGWLLGQLFPDATAVMPQEQERGALTDPQEDNKDNEQPWWFRVLLWTFGVGAVAAVLLIAMLLLWFAFRRFVKQREGNLKERRESIEPSSSLAADLSDLMGAITRRFRRPPRPQQALQIRRLYFDMLDAAQARGLERPSAATPLQFAPQLDAHFSSPLPSAISRAFAESRYGELAIDADVVRRLRDGWHALRDSAR